MILNSHRECSYISLEIPQWVLDILYFHEVVSCSGLEFVKNLNPFGLARQVSMEMEHFMQCLLSHAYFVLSAIFSIEMTMLGFS